MGVYKFSLVPVYTSKYTALLSRVQQSIFRMRAGMENVMFWSNLVTGVAYYAITIQLFFFINNPKVNRSPRIFTSRNTHLSHSSRGVVGAAVV